MYVEDTRSGIRAVIFQYATIKGVRIRKKEVRSLYRVFSMALVGKKISIKYGDRST